MRYFFSLALLYGFCTCVSAQVGVGTTTPSQELEVAGKIKIGNDGRTPTAGTLRYSPSNTDFEGYDGNEWKSLTEGKSNGTPSDPVPYFGRSSPIFLNNEVPASITFESWANSAVRFSMVPAGRFFLVTRIQVQDNDLNSDRQRMDVTIYAGNNSFSRSSSLLRLSGYNWETVMATGDQSNPLFILREDERVRIYNNRIASETTLNVIMHGFLVDELDF